MNPIVTIRQLRDRLTELVDNDVNPDAQLVLTTRENAGSLIGLAAVDGVEYMQLVTEVPGVQFSGIEEL